jgi:hypothetical protein
METGVNSENAYVVESGVFETSIPYIWCIKYHEANNRRDKWVTIIVVGRPVSQVPIHNSQPPDIRIDTVLGGIWK